MTARRTTPSQCRSSALDLARQAVERLSRDELIQLQAEIDLLLEAIAVIKAVDAVEAGRVIALGAPGCYVEWKTIPGKNGKRYGPYPYLRWREGGRLRNRYLKGYTE